MKRIAESTITFSLEQLHRDKSARDVWQLAAQTLFCAVFALSILAGILEAIQVPVPYSGMVLTVIPAAIGLQALSFLDERKSRVGSVIAFFLPLVGAGLLWKWVKNGIALCANQVLCLLGAAQGEIHMPFLTDEHLDMDLSILAVCILTCIWMTLLTVYLHRERHPFLTGVIVVLLVLLNGCLPQWASGMWLLVTGLCTGILFAKDQIGQKRFFGQLAAFTLCIAAIISVFCCAVAEPVQPVKESLTDSARTAIQTWIDEIRYGDDSQRAMPMGDFSQLDDLTFSDAAMLKLEGDEWESLYLRGFVGGTFDGEKWNQVDGDELYKSSNTFYWLHEDGLFGQNQLAYAAQMLNQKGAKEKLTYTVENVGADSSVFYAPYELTALKAEEEDQLQSTILSDTSLWTDGWTGTRSYEIETLTNQVIHYPDMIAALIEDIDADELQDFRNAESHYNEFVYDHYTNLSEEERKLLKNHLGEAGYEEGLHLEYEEAKEKILTYLESRVTYAEVVQERDEGVDFVEDFLDVSMSGYSVHYATAATLMFRYYGIPARYVEGYLLTPDAVKEAKGEDELILTDKSAHAWVEYYQDGIGWIPFEVTPPYMDVMEQPEGMQTAGARQSYSESGGQSLGMEMIEDNYEADEPEKEEEKNDLPWKQVLLGGSIILLLVILGIFARHFYLRHKKIAGREASFRQEDRSKAVIALFAYILQLQQALGIPQQNCSVYAYGDAVEELVTAEMKKDYLEAAALYQKAAYSQKQMTEEERNCVFTYKERVLTELKQRSSLGRRFRLRWINGLY